MGGSVNMHPLAFDLASSSRVIIGLSLAWLASPWVLGGALYAGAVVMNLQSIIP